MLKKQIKPEPGKFCDKNHYVRVQCEVIQLVAPGIIEAADE